MKRAQTGRLGWMKSACRSWSSLRTTGTSWTFSIVSLCCCSEFFRWNLKCKDMYLDQNNSFWIPCGLCRRCMKASEVLRCVALLGTRVGQKFLERWLGRGLQIEHYLCSWPSCLFSSVWVRRGRSLGREQRTQRAGSGCSWGFPECGLERVLKWPPGAFLAVSLLPQWLQLNVTMGCQVPE